MKILVCLLTYGTRPKDILFGNILRAGYPAVFTEVCMEGIAQAQNEGIQRMRECGAEAITYLSNDIVEPEAWLRKKVTALRTYPNAGVIASTLGGEAGGPQRAMIISNWLVSAATVARVGHFNETLFPYGPIDLDYCERCWVEGVETYYAADCQAEHRALHATGSEYGWSKDALVAQYWPQFHADIQGYKNGSKPVYLASSRQRELAGEPFYWTETEIPK